ncbi:peptidoglycan DD-metalloendopeptidase family protein [Lacinutrix salivirga]
MTSSIKKFISASFFLFGLILVHGQHPNLIPNGGEFEFNPTNSPCLTDLQRHAIISELKANKDLLMAQNKLASVNKNIPNPLFIWPIQKSAGNPYNDVWSISGYVDHNIGFNGQLQDYNCGTRTYDTPSYNHQGLDIFTWPFSWKMLDDDAVEVIAASGGQIIAKGDGEFDRSCNFNNNQWNAVYVRHNDGSVAWYGHLKNGSVTTKNVGDFVTQGEYLGVVGSSGNSTGPHLHFEIWENDSYTNLIDPYAGPCNNWNTQSWWQTQKPYTNPGINAVLTGTATPDFGSCPTTEITNESTAFADNEVIYFSIYLRDQYAGSSVNLRVIKPDNTDLYNWNFNLTANYQASWWYWNFPVTESGTWKWQATYEGETVTQDFTVGALSTEEFSIEHTSVYPNPVNNALFIISETTITHITITDVLGKTIINIKSPNIETINTESLSNGLYFLTLSDAKNKKKTIKILKE